MSGELEAAGAMATAGLAAGAIEGREAHGAREGACLNCGAVLAGPYCSQCGQAGHAHRTLLHMFEEVLHGLFHFDAKAWRTLPMLVFRPGTLTHNYIYGKRARYISPLALFLFAIFLMFFVFTFVDMPFNVNSEPRTRDEIAAGLVQAREGLSEARAELAEAEAAPPDPHTGTLDVRLARQSVSLLEAQIARSERQLAALDAANGTQAEASPAAGDAKTWQEQVSQAAKDGKINIGSPFPALNERIVHSLENPDLAIYKILNAAYKFSFLLVPISLPFLWLLFVWRRGLTLYDHAVFILYSLAFASLVFILIAITAGISWLSWVGGAVLGLGMPVHMYFHLKGAYGLGWWSAFWRTLFLLLFALLALAIFVFLFVLLGLGG